MSTTFLTLMIEHNDGSLETIHGVKAEGEQLKACIEGDPQKLLSRLSYLLELLSTEQYSL